MAFTSMQWSFEKGKISIELSEVPLPGKMVVTLMELRKVESIANLLEKIICFITDILS